MTAVLRVQRIFRQALLARLPRALATRATDGALNAPLLDANEIAMLAQQANTLATSVAQRPDVQFRYAGDMRSIHLGQGLDFEESRLYQRGDDLRSMDWRTTARTGKAYVKVFREEHQAAVHFVVDRGATLRFGTQRRLKIAQAARVAVLGAFAALRKGTNIGGYLVEPQPIFFPPASGHTAAWRLVEAAISPAPPLASSVGSFWQSLETLDKVLARGTRVVLISDFVESAPNAASLISRLAQLFELAAYHVYDPAEVELPNIGLARFRNLSGADSFLFNTGDMQLREEFRAAQRERHNVLREMFARVGVSVVRCPTTLDDLPLSV